MGALHGQRGTSGTKLSKQRTGSASYSRGNRGDWRRGYHRSLCSGVEIVKACYRSLSPRSLCLACPGLSRNGGDRRCVVVLGCLSLVAITSFQKEVRCHAADCSGFFLLSEGCF
jgi:hypothetical protein